LRGYVTSVTLSLCRKRGRGKELKKKKRKRRRVLRSIAAEDTEATSISAVGGRRARTSAERSKKNFKTLWVDFVLGTRLYP
jgi:hypothetical protein